jgi:hypothetical protein
MGNVIAASRLSYDAMAGLGADSDDGPRIESGTRSMDPPPKMTDEHKKLGRKWVSLDAEHKVRRLRWDKKEKKAKLTKDRITLKTETWYQMKRRDRTGKQDLLVFYNTRGRPIGVIGANQERNLPLNHWTPPEAPSP